MRLTEQDKDLIQGVKRSGAVTLVAVTAAITATGDPTRAIALGAYGTLAIELLTTIMPERWQKRQESMIALWEKKLEEHTEQIKSLKEKINSESFGDLLQEATIQSFDAITEERIEHLASLLKNSLTPAEIDFGYSKRMFEILGQLDDIDVILLRAHVQTHSHYLGDEAQAFSEKHKEVLRFLVPPHSAEEDYQQAREKHILFLTRLDRLCVLQLIGLNSNKYLITQLGYAFLRQIDADGLLPIDKIALGVPLSMRSGVEASEKINRFHRSLKSY